MIRTAHTQKCLNDAGNHNAVVTQLEPDIVEWDVKWTLGSITVYKASGGDEIPSELLQILKDAAVKEKLWQAERAC